MQQKTGNARRKMPPYCKTVLNFRSARRRESIYAIFYATKNGQRTQEAAAVLQDRAKLSLGSTAGIDLRNFL